MNLLPEEQLLALAELAGYRNDPEMAATIHALYLNPTGGTRRRLRALRPTSRSRLAWPAASRILSFRARR